MSLEQENMLRAWLTWFRRSGDGSMAGLTDVQYAERLRLWIHEGAKLADETQELLP